ncbi:hypothetical protein PssvBMR2_gp20 [Pseudomonas phage MR2]|uniref:Uncharacterized protein n=1 Tax=Pseudomonas phage MR2 TaxID=2711170 RepID=A0A6M3TA75_9CAUD|nr:hypothetical protein PssvBMR2_gp20 [Pseudomonas phage MR2]
MNRAQGNTRALPDGFLHVQNFTVTKQAGIAAIVWTHAFTLEQREIVEDILRGLAEGDERRCHYKHGCWRFSKPFLKVNFEWAVFKVAQALRLDPAQTLYQLVLQRDRAINKD